ncbi:MAG: hypothetical protein PHV16_02785 [Candidatus Nanoarchaeia archaeon]|nr:hypothetical protein [Candidatus Nanoarchaeia archaeon]
MSDKNFVVKIKKRNILIGLSILLVITLIVIFKPILGNNNSSGKVVLDDSVDIWVLNDLRCDECAQISGTVSQLKSLFPNLKFKEVDYMNDEGEKLYEYTNITYLPAIFFKDSVKEQENYNQVSNYLEQKGDFLSLRIGADFDPNGEICDNEIDDTGNGLIDCEDESCSEHPACMEMVCNDGIDNDGDGLIDCEDPDCDNNWQCMPKMEKPVVDVFVMSHCPYGTQIEKGILPVLRLLGDKIDFNMRFVYYAMHGEVEVNEQTLQYCIQKEYNDKYLDYLECFLKEGKTEECVEEVGLKGQLDDCIAQTDEEFKMTEKLNDKTTWMGNYPPFDIDKELNEKYGVRGSPTLVINGVVASASRDPASLLDAICTGFIEKPEECSEQLSSTAPSPGFGFEGTSASSAGSCN